MYKCHDYPHENVFFIDIICNLKGIKTTLNQSYDKQNLTLMIISYEINQTRQRLVLSISYEMTTHVRSSILTMSMFSFNVNGPLLEGSNMMFHSLTFPKSRGKCGKLRAKPEVFNLPEGPCEC